MVDRAGAHALLAQYRRSLTWFVPRSVSWVLPKKLKRSLRCIDLGWDRAQDRSPPSRPIRRGRCWPNSTDHMLARCPRHRCPRAPRLSALSPTPMPNGRRGRSWRRARKEERAAAGSSMAEGSEQVDNEMAAKIAAEAVPDPGRQIYLNEAKTRIDAALGAEIGLAERLVWFWSNHFCISANKIQSMAGAYEREAIRPFVLGRFADMLQAVETHPAMLIYLDNARSIGPSSQAGRNRG